MRLHDYGLYVSLWDYSRDKYFSFNSPIMSFTQPHINEFDLILHSKTIYRMWLRASLQPNSWRRYGCGKFNFEIKPPWNIDIRQKLLEVCLDFANEGLVLPTTALKAKILTKELQRLKETYEK